MLFLKKQFVGLYRIYDSFFNKYSYQFVMQFVYISNCGISFTFCNCLLYFCLR